MNFLVLPPEVNSALMLAGPGSEPMLAAAAAWKSIGSELSSAATAFSSVTSDLAREAWQGPASVSMANATAPYAGWLTAAGAHAEESASQAQTAAAAVEAARSTMVQPEVVTANRALLVSLVRANLFGQNAAAIAAAEASYEQMWAHAVSVMAGYHATSSSAVAQLGSWQHMLENLAGLPGQTPSAVANVNSVVQQEVQQTATATTAELSQIANKISIFINGTPPSPAIPATQNPTFTGSPSLETRLEVRGLYVLKTFGINFETQVAPLIASTSPPKILTMLLGETVTRTTFDGMTVLQITPAHPSGHYVIALHGGGFTVQPTILHWLDYTMMANQTGATIEVPLYPLVQQGGTAGVVVPEMADLIEMNIAAHGASNVSVLGDSAGGTMALAAAELLVSQNETLPASMVLFSPALDLTMSNPNISLINDPVLNAAAGRIAAQEWAGNLPLTDPLVSPLYGSLQGLPPTYVYSGSLEILAPDVLRLSQDAAAQGAPISFVLQSGQIHDWALTASAYQPQIEKELGL
jgi:triacylglycerol lipase